MLHLFQPDDRAYTPETVALMTAAFERACQSASPQIDGNDEVRERLALIILQHVDQGERDPVRLADVAFRELASV